MVRTAGHLTETGALNGLNELIILPVGLGSPADLAPRQLGVSRGMADGTIEGGGLQETLLVASLDWLWPKICGEDSRIHGIKIDVQGMEGDALRGMIGTLRASHPKLVIQFH